jgi:hypothetical protein
MKLDHTTLSKDPSLGFYEIGNKIYWDKATALIEGSRLGYKYQDIHWNFNDKDFSTWDWSIEPPGNIREYYHARARHLREKYDYIIMNCSGGADSTTMLYSFIQQGLHVDEVFVRHATAGTNKYKTSDTEFDASNEHSEFEYAALPLLNWLSQVSPRTKITVHDFSIDILDGNINWDENFIYWCGDYVTPGCIVRYTHVSDKDSLNTFDRGKRVCILFGTDKPRLAVTPDGYLVTFFGDRAVSSAIPATVNNGFDNINVELFYWSPDAAPLMIKQCHVLKRWFELPENKRLQYMLDSKWLLNSLNRTLYESIIKGIIYPDYDLTTFQCNKPVKTVFQEWDYWMADHKNSNGFNTFMRGMNFLYKNIDSSFLKIPDGSGILGQTLNEFNWEYKICSSNKYVIGKMNNNLVF